MTVWTLQDARQKREDLGVQLFSFQQQLRGIYESMDQGSVRDSQLHEIRTSTAKELIDGERELHVLEQKIRQDNQQVLFLPNQLCPHPLPFPSPPLLVASNSAFH